jgi:hypothetical protein
MECHEGTGETTHRDVARASTDDNTTRESRLARARLQRGRMQLIAMSPICPSPAVTNPEPLAQSLPEGVIAIERGVSRVEAVFLVGPQISNYGDSAVIAVPATFDIVTNLDTSQTVGGVWTARLLISTALPNVSGFTRWSSLRPSIQRY